VNEPSSHPRDRLRRELGLVDATMLVVSSVIGVGLFLTPGRVAAELPDARLFLLAWLVGGLLSLAGALANAELGAMFPRAGGDYVYVSEAYGPLAGFLVGWLSFFVVYAGTIATLATGFAEGLEPLLAETGLLANRGLGEVGRIAIALVLIALTSWVNYRGVRSGASFNNVTAVLKIATLAALGLIGWTLAPGSAPAVAGPTSPAAVAAPSLIAFGLALSPVLFTYLGWNAPVYVASEIRNPGRNVPGALFLGLAICTALYLLLNGLYLQVLSIGRLAGDDHAAESAATALFGDLGGTIVALLILVSIVGCLNATILVGPRIAYAMALDGLFFSGTDRVHDRLQTPHVAILVQAIVAALLVAVLRTFPSLLDYTTFAILLAAMASTSALYVLRWKRPDLPRPYRAWAYPLVPGLYFAANAAIALALLGGRPLECATALAVTATGLPFLALFARRERAARRAGPDGRDARP
jgi:APA family basic amino acid/polyamine antiporter